MIGNAPFNPYGIVFSTPFGDMILNAGPGITIFPQGNMVTISATLPTNTIINNITPWQPPSISDANAPNGTMYYSVDSSKLVFKDYSGVVNNLY